MFRKKVSTAYRLLQDEGVKHLLDYAWLRLQVLAHGDKQEVRLDGCTFDLAGITNESIRTELICNRFESAERRAVRRYLKRNIPVVELGGSMGVVACVTNKRLADRKAHVVVEANPMALPQLELNKKRNRGEFAIVNRAIAYGADTITFCPSSDLAGNSITRAGEQPPVTVKTVSVGELLQQNGFERFSLVCDIEGAEYDMVCHEEAALKKADTIVMETHARYIGLEKTKAMMSTLHALGFKIVKEIGFVVVLQQS
jgi:FkbM family methyltransferase